MDQAEMGTPCTPPVYDRPLYQRDKIDLGPRTAKVIGNLILDVIYGYRFFFLSIQCPVQDTWGWS